jgi:hypothetical protein
MGDKIVKYETLYVEKENNNIVEVKIQKTLRESGRQAIQIYIPISESNKEHSAVLLVPTYKELIHILTGLVDIHGKSEVEKELDIKIGGEKDGN